MTPASLSTVQAQAKTCLSANAAFAGLGIFLQLDETATPDQLAAAITDFETAMTSTGVAVLLLSPALVAVGHVQGSALSTELAVTVAIVENPRVNRAAADAATIPPRTPANKSIRKLLEAAVAALLPEFVFPPQVAGDVEWADGYWAQYLVAHKRHVIRVASSP